MKRILQFVGFTLGCELVGILSTPFTLSAITDWYQYLQKPSFSPPNWVFGPVWTILYFLMGVSVFIIWNQKSQKSLKRTALVYFSLQLGLNFLWSLLFFGLRNPLLGLVDIVLLIIFILLTIKSFWKISPLAAGLLLPYLLWVSFATMLNIAIGVLNW